ncbi:MAG: hypothetical protein IT440_02095, partial [Phycisphaeraceae bacterium]|nr:hypothetical protein [Phycisphaeraceae bacterium]
MPGNNTRRGSAATLAMIYLVLFSTLAVAMVSVSGNNMATADNLADVAVAQANAETGLRWMSYRFVQMARPRTTVGTISPQVASSLWPKIASAVQGDFAEMLLAAERSTSVVGTAIQSAAIATDAGSFQISIRQHPLDADDPLDARHLRVTSTGRFGAATRSVSQDFRIDKRSRFAVVGKVPIQLGRNTIVEGPIAMATANKYP